MAKKTVEKWEKEAGLILLDTEGISLKKSMDREEFDALVEKVGAAGIDYKTREKWLKDNGYDVTRDNIRNATLPSKLAE